MNLLRAALLSAHRSFRYLITHVSFPHPPRSRSAPFFFRPQPPPPFFFLASPHSSPSDTRCVTRTPPAGPNPRAPAVAYPNRLRPILARLAHLRNGHEERVSKVIRTFIIRITYARTSADDSGHIARAYKIAP